MSTLGGKHAIVTGSTQGLGEATARLFVDRGASGVTITGRDADRGKRVATDLCQGDCNAFFVQADLADPDSCGQVVSDSIERFGQIHILVNAAGLTTRGTIYDTTLDVWNNLIDVNLRAPFLLMQACVNHMRDQAVEGSIVNVISTSAYGGQPFLTPYSTSKGDLATLTKNVAYAVVRNRIRVNGLMLGWMDTPGEDHIQRTVHSDGKDWLDEAEADRPFGRLIKVDEAARAIAYLASDESGLMTGALVDFDQSVIGGGDAPVPVHGEFGTQ